MSDPDGLIVDRLYWVFGVVGATDPIEAALKSERKFVRGRYQISVYDESRNPTGSVVSAYEALMAYGLDVLDESIEYGSALLLKRPNAVGTAIRDQRIALGLERKAVASKSQLSAEDISRIEEGKAEEIPFPDIERVAFAIGLDERQIAFNPTVTNIAARLKTMQREAPGVGLNKLTPSTVTVLTEAASVIRIQTALQTALKLPEMVSSFEPSDYYGKQPWKVGYQLADDTRYRLGLGNEPITSMRELVETTLGIPVVQAELHAAIAGVTISVADGNETARGIVLNTKGPNDNPLVRRATLAHELGHLLYDPDSDLEGVHVDSYKELERDPEHRSAVAEVEKRANAFAISFLAPIDAVRDRVGTPIVGTSIKESDVLDTVSWFKISVTAARFHVHNVHYRAYDVPSIHTRSVPDDELRAAEDFTVTYFPLRKTPIARCGRFAGLVIRAWKENLISEETATRYLNCTVVEFRANADTIESLYTW